MLILQYIMDTLDDIKVKMTKSKWSAEKTWKFVVEYRNRACLWNSKLVSYKDRNIKDVAYAELAEMFGCGVNDIKIKIKNLRTTYIQEYKKVMESIKANNGKEGTYVPSLVWYNEMDSFLRYTSVGKITPVSSSSDSDKLETQVIHIKEEVSDTTEPVNTIQILELPSVQNRELRQNKENPQNVTKKRKQSDLLNIHTLENLNNDFFEEHEFDIFGKSVAKQLKSFSSIAAALRVQSKIQSLLTEERIQDQIAAADSNSQRQGTSNQRFFYNQTSSESNWSGPSTVTEVCMLPSSTQDTSNLSNDSDTSRIFEGTKEFEVAFMD